MSNVINTGATHYYSIIPCDKKHLVEDNTIFDGTSIVSEEYGKKLSISKWDAYNPYINIFKQASNK